MCTRSKMLRRILFQIECVLFVHLATAYSDSSSNHLTKSGKVSRIFGGIPSKINESPWMAALFYNEKFHCSSGIVSRFHLVSAAHCFRSETRPYTHPLSVKIAIGEISLTYAKYNKRLRNVSKIDVHPDLKFLIINRILIPLNDIAVITLEEMIDFNLSIKPLILPEKDEMHYRYAAKLAGWGTTEQRRNSDTLLYTTISILENNICLSTPIADFFATENFPGYMDSIYCGYGGKGDGCQGDSGSPLVVRTSRNTWKLVGVMSWGIGCGNVSLPAVYTKTSYYSNWIRGIINKKVTYMNHRH